MALAVSTIGPLEALVLISGVAPPLPRMVPAVLVSVADAAADVLLQELPDKTDKTAALSGISAASPNVHVTIDFRHAGIATSKSYLLRVRGTIGSRKEEALWVFNTGWE